MYCSSFGGTQTACEPILPVSAHAASGPLSAKLLRNGVLKTYKDFPHGMPTTQADTITPDLLAFIKG